MAFDTAHQHGIVPSARREAAPDSPSRAARGGRLLMLGTCVALSATLISVCMFCGPGPLVWTVVAAIWTTLAVVCVRLQVGYQRSSTGG